MATKPEPHIIDVDLKQSTQFKVPKVTQVDTAIFFLLRITDDGRSDPELLDYFPTITLTSERPDGQSFYVLGDRVEGTNEVMFHLGTDETLLTGSVRAAVQLYSVDGRNTSAQFRYEVDKDLTGEYVPSEREGSLIEQVLVQGPVIMAAAEQATLAAIKAREELTGAVNGALDELQTDKAAALEEMSTAVTEANTARDGANAAATRADGAADDADSAAYFANQTKEETETVRQNTEAERLATSEEREKTEVVRSSVEELIPQTEQARDGAVSAGEFAREQGGIAQQQIADQLEQMGTVAEQLEYVQDEFLPGIAGSVAETGRLVSETLQNADKKYAKIYGAVWGKSSNSLMARTGDAIGMVANVGVDDQLVRNDFDYAQIYRDMKVVEDDYGNRFLRIPKCYIQKKNGPLYYSEAVSLVMWDGFYRPAVFWDFENGVELPYYDHAIHLATESPDGKLESKPGRYPLTSINIVEARDKATANNVNGKTGYQLLDIHASDLLSVLFHVEFATLNSQSVMQGWSTGRYTSTDLAVVSETRANRIIIDKAIASNYRVGQPIGVGTSQGGHQVFYGRDIVSIEDYDEVNSAITFDGDPVNIAAGNFLYNIAWKTGFSEQITASSGSIGDNTSGKYPCMYRGIESPWGDILQFVDGVNITDLQAWVTQDARNYASNVFMEPYEPLSYVNHDANGYVSEMGFDENHPYAQFPIAVGAGTSTYYADYYYQATGARLALVGGHWSYGSPAGLSYWALTWSSGTRYLSGGARLLKKAS